MKTKILDGNQASLAWLKELNVEINEHNKNHQPIALAIVQVGSVFASNVYIKNKIRIAKTCGVLISHHQLAETITEKELIVFIQNLIVQKEHTGILVQLPLPVHINEQKILELIPYEMDVDGFSHTVISEIWSQKNYDPLTTLTACTPKGILRLLKHYEIALSGKHVVIINRSNIVGKPLAALLLSQNATVTIAHSRTQNLKKLTKIADIVVTGVGQINFLDASHIVSHSVVIDVSMNKNEENKLIGDVTFGSLNEKCFAYSPVPGGVGPMTIAAIISNLLLLAQKYPCKKTIK